MSDDRITLETILHPDRTFRRLAASSKKKAIELAAITLADLDSSLDVGEVYRALIDREKLGTTAIGHGVAIPHCRTSSCQQITGALFVFDEPVDFAAYDDVPVSIMFVLLVPESETADHLKTLALIAERAEDAAYRQALIKTSNDASLYEQAVSGSAPSSASSTG